MLSGQKLEMKLVNVWIMIDIPSGRIQIWDCNGQYNQQWFFQSPYIRSVWDGKYLTILENRCYDGTKVGLMDEKWIDYSSWIY